MAAHNARHPPGWLPPGYAPPEQQSLVDISRLYNLTTTQKYVLAAVLLLFLLSNFAFFRLATILSREKPTKRPKSNSHLLVMLGSGGHTAEMLSVLSKINLQDFTRRTYIVSSGDNFSASKAIDFEKEYGGGSEGYDIITVRRARRVHQSLASAPFTTILCFWDCWRVLASSPDLILTNGPGTGVCIVVAAIVRLFLGADIDKMRTIFIESWARVKTLSLSGRILKPFVDRFIVQWPELAKVEGSRVEYIGPLVS